MYFYYHNLEFVQHAHINREVEIISLAPFLPISSKAFAIILRPMQDLLAYVLVYYIL